MHSPPPTTPSFLPGSRALPCRRFGDGRSASAEDHVVVEEPLEIRVDGQPFVTTMRTPGNDRELALGLLLCEGWLNATADVAVLVHCGRTGTGAAGERAVPADRAANSANVVDLRRGEEACRRRPPPNARLPATSSCGVCGKRSIADVLARTPLGSGPRSAPEAEDGAARFSAEVLGDLPRRLRGAQALFDRTGGLHAAGLFAADGELLVAREDIGRHNAVDKVIGWAVLEERLPLADCALQVSGRASFEIVQKAYAAGIPLVSAVSGVSSLAIELACAAGLTLIGFAREGRLTVYSRSDRVVL